jgi:hypothetical protein
MCSRAASHEQPAQRVVVIDDLADALSILTLQASRTPPVIVAMHFLIDDETS